MAKEWRKARQDWRIVAEDEQSSEEPSIPIQNTEDWITNMPTNEIVQGLVTTIKKLKGVLADHDQYPGHHDLEQGPVYQGQVDDNVQGHHA